MDWRRGCWGGLLIWVGSSWRWTSGSTATETARRFHSLFYVSLDRASGKTWRLDDVLMFWRGCMIDCPLLFDAYQATDLLAAWKTESSHIARFCSARLFFHSTSSTFFFCERNRTHFPSSFSALVYITQNRLSTLLREKACWAMGKGKGECNAHCFTRMPFSFRSTSRMFSVFWHGFNVFFWRSVWLSLNLWCDEAFDQRWLTFNSADLYHRCVNLHLSAIWNISAVKTWQLHSVDKGLWVLYV
jgi:hypothetical protein